MRNNLQIRPATPAALWLALTFTVILAACGGGGSGSSGSSGGATAMACAQYGGTCPAPTVSVTAPGATLDLTVTLSASAAAAGASVTSVEFLVDGASVGSASTAPYTVSWDSTTVSDGTHTLTASVTDSQGQTASSAPVTISVDNNPAFTVAMGPGQVFPVPTSSATGTASLTVKLASGTVSGKVTVSGVTASAVTINQAFAGNSGAGLVTLTANASSAGEWDVPSGALLSSEQITALMQGGLYVLASSAANPAGEIRGQITPGNVTLVYGTLSGSQEVPPLSITASGIAAVTVDSSANTLTVHVHDTGVADATAASVNTAAAAATGPQLVALNQDSTDSGHWSVQLASITAADVANFKANQWYVNVVTAAETAGAIRAQIDATSTPPPATPTLTQLTTTVFAVCGTCHTGGGTSLPSSMNLTSGHIYASIVNVPSVEQPALLRVKPGDPADSYVVQKLEGAPTISGARMPFGGPYLSQATIDQLEAWISAGAPNN
jgi:hypothetical protein